MIEVKHGLTMADLDRAARMALGRNVGVNAFSWAERYDMAWSAAALALCEATEPPTVSDLASAGWQAVADARQTEMRHHGIDSTRRIGEGRPMFERYWSWMAAPARSFEDGVVERLALRQVWPLLTGTQRAALVALAVHGSVPLAAQATGVGASALHRAAWLGRERFMRYWHEGETPPVRRGRDRRRDDGQPVDPRAGYRATRRSMRRRAA